VKFLNLKIQNCGCGWSWSRSDFFRSLMERTFTLSLAHYCRNRRSWWLANHQAWWFGNGGFYTGMVVFTPFTDCNE